MFAVNRRALLAWFGACVTSSNGWAQERVPSLVQDGKTFAFLEPMPQAPNVSLLRLDGGRSPLLDPRDRRPVLLNFWATWCPPCRVEIPFLQSHYSPGDPGQPRILPVSVDKGGEQDVVPFLRKYAIKTLPIFLDPEGDVGRKPTQADAGYPLLLRWMPLTYVMTWDGRVVGYFPGVIDWRQGGARGFFAAVAEL